ncbi:ATP-dependent RNA helicase DHX33-like [Paramacrobiotus metropolitanus]|uniref:ATP-dependent RNA helicase DHX33-like n=1 Tax=Paramacrobiotus metropolitanus TaxID=2943436 RepID=UPI002445DE45|nr:ATP-dependent RNA helicase DHX33-like [Paramacrobiotus metropolitanus]
MRMLSSPVRSQSNGESAVLPVLQYQHHLAEALHQHAAASTVIIVSDTGSGKTTQIPQLLLRRAFDGFFDPQQHRPRCMAVTQPRRVAAVSVAARVAKEMQCDVGQLVGYAVRFEECSSRETQIKYMTDGMLVREAQGDWMFKQYNLIILDEVHERSLATDVLLGLVRKAQVRRRKFAQQDKSCLPLKVIVMSATMETEKMQTFWKDAPVLYIPGRTFPVEIMYSPQSIDDYVHAAIVSVFQIHRASPPGGILVFLTGREEIEESITRCQQLTKSLPDTLRNIAFFPLFANLPTDVQMEAMKKSSPGNRKVIFATNVAETSVTIPGVKYVIDSGRVKSKTFSPATGMDLLKVRTVAQAQAWQRSGRAGREQPGTCYRLYTEDEFSQWPEQPVPEILRCNLSTILLQMISMGVDKPLAFPFYDAPEAANIQCALDQLGWLGAIESSQEPVATTEAGKIMAGFPLDPRYSRCILRAQVHQCTEEVCTIIAMLSSDSPFISLMHKRKEAAAVHEKFLSNEGDHLSLLNVWRRFKDEKQAQMWCHANYLNRKNLIKAEQIRKQLVEVLNRQEIPMVSCGLSTTAVRKALCEGMFMCAAERQPDGTYLTLDTKRTVALHPSSSLFKTRPGCVVYNELVQTTKTFIRDLCLVERDWLDNVGKNYYMEMRQKMTRISTKHS